MTWFVQFIGVEPGALCRWVRENNPEKPLYSTGQEYSFASDTEMESFEALCDTKKKNE